MMNKMPKEKRNKIILVWVLVIGVIACWVLVVLKWQLEMKQQAAQSYEKQRSQYISMTNRLSQADAIQEEMAEAAEKLSALESRMISGDPYSWVLDTISKFKQNYEVDIPQFGQPSAIVENTLLPKFPYKQASLTVAGSAFYQDLGLFIADFENQFRFARIINLEIEPNSSANSNDKDREKLNFRFDLVFLVKPNRP